MIRKLRLTLSLVGALFSLSVIAAPSASDTFVDDLPSYSVEAYPISNIEFLGMCAASYGLLFELVQDDPELMQILSYLKDKTQLAMLGIYLEAYLPQSAMFDKRRVDEAITQAVEYRDTIPMVNEEYISTEMLTLGLEQGLGKLERTATKCSAYTDTLTRYIDIVGQYKTLMK